jgi:ankyrin repeat protein
MLLRRDAQRLKQLLFLAFLTAGFAFLCDCSAAWSKDNRAAELIRAIRDGENKKANKLIKQKKGVDAQDDYGWTPLMYAVLGKNIEAIQQLLAQGADINAQDQDGVTPLIASIINAPQPFMVQYMSDEDKRKVDIPLILIERS